ncbi:PTS system, N-acetylmuramic acid-specific IIB component [Spiroplasma sp. TIUS-1]|uniref:PTS transporter subunit EIIC n=1 Tax=Spiroplasma sp. TIUS-1 TaxID=216963 RepID=UPI00139872FC|nr:PTS transporter subunit EIIC [Spiroplasma sp. TIUS-1]QHX35746.1 PTS system, N-acetylmuramic acid-specific IIB component [Spiroplasma sp. TIUS-1]
MAKARDVALDIKNVIGEENIISYTNCMTRLRVKAKPNFEKENLKKVDGVLGLIVAGEEYQIVLGPGFVNKVALEFSKIVSIQSSETINENLDASQNKTAAEVAIETKNKLRGKSGVQTFLAKISKVFTPLIPAFIGAGLLTGIAGILSSTVNGDFTGHDTLKAWNGVLSIMLTLLTNVFIIAVGWRMAEEWGGNPGIGAMIAAVYTPFAGAAMAGLFIGGTDGVYNFLGITINNIEKNWLTVGFITWSTTTPSVASLGAPHAGLIGAMIAVGTTIFVEKQFRKIMPGALDTILTPVIVIFIMLMINLFLIIPVAGYMFTGITWLFNNLYTNPFGASILAGIFLFALVFGVHQGFLPIYFALIAETGVNGLFPILAMGGTSQVGVAIGLYIMAEKDSLLRKQISGAIIPGFLGIGEPLIYGVSLPRIKPFVVSCITAAFGGFYIGAISLWGGVQLGMNAPTGPGGLVATIMMTTVDGNVLVGVMVYLSAVILTYFLGAMFVMFAYSKIASNGSNKTKEIYKSDINIGKKIGWTIAFLTIVGIFVSWFVWWNKLTDTQKLELKGQKVE